jgi:hypothetical protein
MGKKGGNLKKEQGNERKEQQKQAKENERKSQKEMAEEEEWKKGAKINNKELEKEKKAEALRKKQEREMLLQMEEKELSQKRPLQRQPKASNSSFKINVTEEYNASGVENALELLTVDSVKLDRHPERRMKSAFAAFEERMLPMLKQENPTLRLSQLKELLQKEWKKSPENPLNQENISYNATQEEYIEKKESVKQQQQEKYRVK